MRSNESLTVDAIYDRLDFLGRRLLSGQCTKEGYHEAQCHVTDSGIFVACEAHRDFPHPPGCRVWERHYPEVRRELGF